VVDGRAVVVVIDTQNLHTLNEVGTFAWERADGRTIGAIADELVATFDVDAERAYADVVRFVEKLVALGALELRATAAIPKGAGG
jgi:hypothetical protein